MPNGNVLVMASPVDTVRGNFNSPSHFWELGFTTNTLTQVADSPNAASFTSFDGHFTMLPSGEALFVAFNRAQPRTWTSTRTAVRRRMPGGRPSRRRPPPSPRGA